MGLKEEEEVCELIVRQHSLSLGFKCKWEPLRAGDSAKESAPASYDRMLDQFSSTEKPFPAMKLMKVFQSSLTHSIQSNETNKKVALMMITDNSSATAFPTLLCNLCMAELLEMAGNWGGWEGTISIFSTPVFHLFFLAPLSLQCPPPLYPPEKAPSVKAGSIQSSSSEFISPEEPLISINS